MFCPKCAAQNVEGASFCRVCGANISLVPQALTGQLPQAAEPEDLDYRSRSRRRRGRSELTLDNAFKNAFMGISVLLISMALAFSRMGTGWLFWMLIPAFSMMGTGVAQYIRIKERQKQTLPIPMQQGSFQPPQPQVNPFPTRATGELVSPPP